MFIIGFERTRRQSPQTSGGWLDDRLNKPEIQSPVQALPAPSKTFGPCNLYPLCYSNRRAAYRRDRCVPTRMQRTSTQVNQRVINNRRMENEQFRTFSNPAGTPWERGGSRSFSKVGPAPRS